MFVYSVAGDLCRSDIVPLTVNEICVRVDFSIIIRITKC